MHANQRGSNPVDEAPVRRSGKGEATSAAAMRRIERSADRVARLELLRGEFQESIIRRESRRAAAEISAHDSKVTAEVTSDARADEDLDAWIRAEADAMLGAGWSREQLAEFGFSPQIIAEAERRHG
jgi:hypothetical protein